MNFDTISDLLDAAVLIRESRPLTKVEKTILAGAWQDETYESIAEGSQEYSINYIKRDVGPKLWKLLSTTLGQEVNKKNFRSVLQQLIHSDFFKKNEQNPSAIAASNLSVERPLSIPKKPLPKSRFDLGDAINIAEFFGRDEQLAKLWQWLIPKQADQQRCRIAALLGIGGIGKTSLAAKLVKQITEQHKEQFDFVIWRSLQDAPPLEYLLTNLLSVITNTQFSEGNSALPPESDIYIKQLMDCLHRHRCLLVFDSVEAILQARRRAGRYREGYEKYGELIKRIGEEAHQSSLILISREKPDEVALMEGKKLYVRSLKLDGFDQAAAYEMIEAKGFVVAEQEQAWNQLIEHYGGNPLAIKIAATAIYELFNGEISEFLYQQKTLFDKIYDSIEEQIERLSRNERTIIDWLAISHIPVSFSELQKFILSPEVKRKFLGVLKSLKDRSLVENQASGFTLQPIVRDYLVEKLIEHFFEALTTEKPELDNTATRGSALNNYALVKAQAEDDAVQRQVLAIVRPVLTKLINQYGSQTAVIARLKQHLTELKHQPPLKAGYAAGNIINLLRELGVSFEAGDYSNQTLWQARLQDLSLRDANFRNSDLDQALFTETIGDVLSLACSANGRYLAAGDSEGKIHVWEFAPGSKTLHKIHSWRGHKSWIRSIAFSPDQQTILTGSQDCTIKSWNLQTQQCVRVWESKEWIRSLQYGPDGQTFITGGDDYAVKLWNLTLGSPLLTFDNDAHLDRVRSVVLSPNRQWIASAGDDRSIILWDAAQGKSITRLEGHTDRIRSVAFSADSRWLASGSDDRTVRLWQLSAEPSIFEKPTLTFTGHSDRVRSVAFSPSGEWLVSGSDDCTLKIWDLSQGTCHITLGEEPTKQIGRIHSVVFKPNSSLLICGRDNQSLQIWDLQRHTRLKTLKGSTLGTQAICFIDDRTLLSGSDDHNIRLWDVQDGHCFKMLSGHEGRITCLAKVSREGSKLPVIASGSDDCTVRHWDLQTEQCLQISQSTTHWIRSIAFSPNGQTLAIAGDDQQIRLWQVNAGCVPPSSHPVLLEGHKHWIRSIAFSPDGRYLASGGDEQFVRLWDVQSRECIRELDKHNHRIQSVAFSPNGDLLASGSDGATIHLWDSATWDLITAIEVEPDDSDCKNGVKSISFSPDGQWLASGSDGAVVRLWNLRDRSNICCSRVLEGHQTGVRAVVFSPNGELLASSSHDGEIRLWEVQTGQCYRSLWVKGPYAGMDITGARALTNVQKAMLIELGAIDHDLVA
ncbi:MAG: NB-ARC domain-containing protein [Elainellaceae cyanobacterium]